VSLKNRTGEGIGTGSRKRITRGKEQRTGPETRVRDRLTTGSGHYLIESEDQSSTVLCIRKKIQRIDHKSASERIKKTGSRRDQGTGQGTDLEDRI